MIDDEVSRRRFVGGVVLLGGSLALIAVDERPRSGAYGLDEYGAGGYGGTDG